MADIAKALSSLPGTLQCSAKCPDKLPSSSFVGPTRVAYFDTTRKKIVHYWTVEWRVSVACTPYSKYVHVPMSLAARLPNLTRRGT